MSSSFSKFKEQAKHKITVKGERISCNPALGLGTSLPLIYYDNYEVCEGNTHANSAYLFSNKFRSSSLSVVLLTRVGASGFGSEAMTHGIHTSNMVIHVLMHKDKAMEKIKYDT